MLGIPEPSERWVRVVNVHFVWYRDYLADCCCSAVIWTYCILYSLKTRVTINWFLQTQCCLQSNKETLLISASFVSRVQSVRCAQHICLIQSHLCLLNTEHRPIRNQYSGHVICIVQWQSSSYLASWASPAWWSHPRCCRQGQGRRWRPWLAADHWGHLALVMWGHPSAQTPWRASDDPRVECDVRLVHSILQMQFYIEQPMLNKQ